MRLLIFVLIGFSFSATARSFGDDTNMATTSAFSDSTGESCVIEDGVKNCPDKGRIHRSEFPKRSPDDARKLAELLTGNTSDPSGTGGTGRGSNGKSN